MFPPKVVQKIKTHVLCSVTFFENCAVYGITFKKLSTAGQATNENIIRRMRIACCIPKALNMY